MLAGNKLHIYAADFKKGRMFYYRGINSTGIIKPINGPVTRHGRCCLIISIMVLSFDKVIIYYIRYFYISLYAPAIIYFLSSL